MAAVSTVIPSPSTPRPFSSRGNLSLRSIRSFRCSASPQENDTSTPQLLKLAVSGVTELLRILSPNKRRDEDWRSEDVAVTYSVDDVVQTLRSDYQNAYFLTGKFTSEIYAEDCLFEDPTIKFRGKDRYSQNLDLLVPFFDRPSLELEKIEKGLDSDMNFISAKWKLRTYLKFPWRPLISIRGVTTYDLDKNFKIVRHAESWSVSALEAVGQIFSLGYEEENKSTWAEASHVANRVGCLRFVQHPNVIKSKQVGDERRGVNEPSPCLVLLISVPACEYNWRCGVLLQVLRKIIMQMFDDLSRIIDRTLIASKLRGYRKRKRMKPNCAACLAPVRTMYITETKHIFG